MRHCSRVSSQTRSVSTTTAVEIEPRMSTSMTPAIVRRVRLATAGCGGTAGNDSGVTPNAGQPLRLIVVGIEIERELFRQWRLGPRPNRRRLPHGERRAGHCGRRDQRRLIVGHPIGEQRKVGRRERPADAAFRGRIERRVERGERPVASAGGCRLVAGNLHVDLVVVDGQRELVAAIATAFAGLEADVLALRASHLGRPVAFAGCGAPPLGVCSVGCREAGTLTAGGEQLALNRRAQLVDAGRVTFVDLARLEQRQRRVQLALRVQAARSRQTNLGPGGHRQRLDVDGGAPVRATVSSKGSATSQR